MGTDAKAELAFNVFDKNHDGYITKNEMLKASKNLTKEQVQIEKISKGSLNLIPSPSPLVKIQIKGGKVCLGCKGKYRWVLSTNF